MMNRPAMLKTAAQGRTVAVLMNVKSVLRHRKRTGEPGRPGSPRSRRLRPMNFPSRRSRHGTWRRWRNGLTTA
jgi:hypothetical protein